MLRMTSRTLLQCLPRLSGWLIITIALLFLVGVSSPQQLPVSLYKLSLVSLAAVIGYWLDRSLFPYARPDQFLNQLYDTDPAGVALPVVIAASMIRRALIVGCAMLAMGLGA